MKRWMSRIFLFFFTRHSPFNSLSEKTLCGFLQTHTHLPALIGLTSRLRRIEGPLITSVLDLKKKISFQTNLSFRPPMSKKRIPRVLRTRRYISSNASSTILKSLATYGIVCAQYGQMRTRCEVFPR